MANSRPVRTTIRLAKTERLDLKPERPGMRPDLSPLRPDLKPDLRPERPCWGGGMNE